MGTVLQRALKRVLRKAALELERQTIIEVNRLNLEKIRDVMANDAEKKWKEDLCHSAYCPAYDGQPRLAATYDACTCGADINRALDETLKFFDGQKVTFECLVGEFQKRYNLNHKNTMLHDEAERRVESLYMRKFIERTDNKGEFDEPLYIVKAPTYPCRINIPREKVRGIVEVNTMLGTVDQPVPEVPVLCNASENKFVDINTEMWREYIFPDGSFVHVDYPSNLSVSKSGGHRILDRDEVCHYIPPGWIHLKWKVFPGKPHFVK
jgi:hypothetical protein